MLFNLGLGNLKRKDNYAEDATAGGLFIDTTHYKVVCPAGKRWFLMGGSIKRDAIETAVGWVFNSDDKFIGGLLSEGASNSLVNYPSADFLIGEPWILNAGDYVSFTFGGAQGAGAYASCSVLEMDI